MDLIVIVILFFYQLYCKNVIRHRNNYEIAINYIYYFCASTYNTWNLTICQNFEMHVFFTLFSSFPNGCNAFSGRLSEWSSTQNGPCIGHSAAWKWSKHNCPITQVPFRSLPHFQPRTYQLASAICLIFSTEILQIATVTTLQSHKLGTHLQQNKTRGKYLPQILDWNPAISILHKREVILTKNYNKNRKLTKDICMPVRNCKSSRALLTWCP